MSLIKSISGIRGTIGGKPNEGLTPIDLVKYTSAYAELRKQVLGKSDLRIVVGRDARISGAMIESLVISTLQAMGVDVINLSLSTTPTVEMAVTELKADGGIILTASHNPVQWNALKLLNERGEFISAQEGARLLEIGERGDFQYADVERLGKLIEEPNFLQRHIDLILADELVDGAAVKNAQLKVVVDGINSSGAFAVPALLKSMGVSDVYVLNAETHGRFAHNPEPLAEHLTEISQFLRTGGADIGIVVDPDVDRLAFVCEDGSMFGEEYTLVAVANYVLSRRPGNTVSNLSSTRALRDVTSKFGTKYTAAAVGEVNVVQTMKETEAVIGGEGNGGIIYPPLHYGRDALAGIALFLSYFVKEGKRMSELRDSLPQYVMAKKKIDLEAGLDVDQLLKQVQLAYAGEEINTADGVKIDFADGWVHLRKSNTEPIIRIYSEGPNATRANELADGVMDQIQKLACL